MVDLICELAFEGVDLYEDATEDSESLRKSKPCSLHRSGDTALDLMSDRSGDTALDLRSGWRGPWPMVKSGRAWGSTREGEASVQCYDA